MKLAVYSLSLSDKKPEEAAALARDFNCDGIEWWCREGGHLDAGDLQNSAKKIAGITDDSGLAAAGISPYFSCSETKDEILSICAAAETLNAPVIRCHGLKYPAREPVLSLADRQRKWLEETVLPALEMTGKKFVLEQHHNTIIPSPCACRKLVEGLPPDRFGVIYDPGNSLFEGYTQASYAVGVLGEYLAHVHVKNAKPVSGEGSAPPGRNCPMFWGKLSEGDLDWREILDELAGANYGGFISLEALDERDSGTKMREDIPYLRGLMNKRPDSRERNPS